MSNLINFDFNNNTVRTITDEHNEAWFVASDVCNILGYANSRKAINDHCKHKGVTKRYTLTEKGEQELTYINEPNLYRLIIKSRKPEAEKFEEWVMEEVLPSIRKTGSYEVAPVYPAVSVISPPVPSHGELYKTFIATVNLQGVMTMRELGKNEFITTHQELPHLLSYQSWHVSDAQMAKIAKAALNKIANEYA